VSTWMLLDEVLDPPTSPIWTGLGDHQLTPKDGVGTGEAECAVSARKSGERSEQDLNRIPDEGNTEEEEQDSHHD
jgi:hypothetical protein